MIVTNAKMNNALIDLLKLNDDNMSKYTVVRIEELESVLAEAKEVLLQLDTRHNGKCYSPGEIGCSCTLCKIDKVLNKAE